MITLTYIRHFVEAHDTIAYLLIVIGVIIEGEIVVVLAGIFANLGSLNIFAAFIATVLGGGIRSILGYMFGYYLQTHHSGRPLLRYVEKRIHYFLPRFSERPFWSVFLSRFLILGMHWFSVLFAGYKKIKIKVFAKAEMSSLFIWSVGMLSIGYFFSFTALSISRDIRKFIIIIFAFFITFFIVEKIVAFIIELISSKEPKNPQT
jgi:membrane protein DedA with SNARE-associated domain